METDHLLNAFQNLDMNRFEPDAWRPISNSLIASVVVAELIQAPIEHAHVIQHVGRFLWVHFQPVRWPDPEIVVALPGPGSVYFNRVSLDFWRVREQGPRNPQKWYQAARTAMLRFLPALGRMQATSDESDFVLEWAADIVAHMRTTRR